MKITHIISHDYAGSNPKPTSRHTSLETAERKLDKMRRSFRRAHKSTFPTRAIFPFSIKEVES